MKQRFSKRTRLVSALLTLAMVFTFLPVSAFAATDGYGPVYLDNHIVPDDTFREYLLKEFDENHNSTLSPTERYAVTAIDVHEKEITSLKGIEFFPNLEILLCSDNQLTELDVSQNTELTWLVCSRNQLTELDVSSNPILHDLSCSGNKLTKLDVSNNPQLQTLDCHANELTELNCGNNQLMELNCYKNQLTELDVSKNAALVELYCSQNNLTNLDVTQNKALRKLRCNVNKLPSLDVSQNTALQELYCSKNNLISLDVTKNIALKELDCYTNQLTSLDVSKNTDLEVLWCYENPLTELDVSKNAALVDLHCSQNNLTSLDVSKNTQLKLLTCSRNNLTSLNVENTSIDPSNPLNLYAKDNTYSIAVESDRTFDLSILPGFDVTKVSKWVGGTVSGNTLTVDEGVNQVTYTYDCGKGLSRDFTLNVNVVPDGTVTPPSGGGTGTTTPPSGGDGTGTTTPPSGGGTGTTTPPSGGDGTGTTTPPSGGDGTGTTTPPSGGDGTGTTTPPSGGDGGGGAVIIMAAGAAAAGVVGYGVYNYVSGRKLQALLPEGVAAPENRAQTALLLWNTAGRPEPAEAPAFADVADPDTAKAAQWCMEQGLMKRRLNGKFAPDSSIPAYQVLNAYRKLAG